MASSTQPAMSISSLLNIRAATYAPVASTTLLLYDFIITFPDEVEFVWPSPWRLGKALFFLTRYPAMINSCCSLFRNVSRSVPHCWGLDAQAAYISIAWITVAEIIMGIRVWALWERDWKIAVFVTFLIVSNLVITAVVESQYLSVAVLYVAPPDLIGFVPGCHDLVGPNLHIDSSLLQVPYYLVMSIEAIMLMLMLTKSFVHYNLIPHSRFLLVFYQDGLMYFAFLTVVSTINIIVYNKAPPEYANLLLSLQRSLHAMLSGRFLLHLKEESGNSRRGPSIHGQCGTSPGPLAFSRSVTVEQEETSTFTSPKHWVDDGTWFGAQPSQGSTEVESRNDYEC